MNTEPVRTQRKPYPIYRRDSFPVGFALGVFFPLIAFALIYIFWFYDGMTLLQFLTYLRIRTNIMAAVISLSLIFNLPVFFVNIWGYRYNTARGVIFATMLFGAVIISLKTF